MKKQKKLMLTIASLCLAVALMAFGVYAATNVSFSISNSVNYTFSDVLVDVSAKLYSVKTGKATIVTEDALASLTATDWTEVTDGVTNGTLKSYTGSNGVYTQDDAASSKSASVNFNLNTAFAYKVEITFSTVSTTGVTVSYNDTAFVDGAADDNVTLVVSPGDEPTISGSDTYVFTYYVLLEDATTEVATTLPELSFTVAKAV